jgi:predicted PurR-regulated permease PerM
MTYPYFLAITFGGLMALLSSRPYQYLKRKNFNHHLAAALVTATVTLIMIGPFLVIASIAVEQAASIGKEMVGGRDFSLSIIIQRFLEFEPVKRIFHNSAALKSNVQSALQTLGGWAASSAPSMLQKFPEYGLQMIIFLLSFHFLLVDGKRFLQWLRDKIPFDSGLKTRLYLVFRDTAISSVWATLAAALAQALIMLIAFVALGVPMAALAAGATFVLSWIPLVGSFPVWTIGMLYLYTTGSLSKVIIMFGMGILTSLADNLVRSLILRGKNKMHPLVSLVAIFGAMRLFGFLGVFFGPILAALLISLLQILPVFANGKGSSEP